MSSILGQGSNDVWQVAAEEDYHEEQTGKASVDPYPVGRGSGREAPYHRAARTPPDR